MKKIIKHSFKKLFTNCFTKKIYKSLIIQNTTGVFTGKA